MKATAFILLVTLFEVCGHSALKMKHVQSISISTVAHNNTELTYRLENDLDEKLAAILVSFE